jgi:hypothetical protein
MRLSLDEPFESGEEIRIGNCGALRVADDGIAFCAERRDCERHSHSMIAVRLDLGAVEAARRAARYAQAVGTFLDLRAHAP